MSLTIRRPGVLGNKIQTRGENHGDETKPAKDIPVSNILLTKEEFNDLLGDPHAWDAIFDSGKSPPEPVFKVFKPLAFIDTFKNCSAEIRLGLKQELVEVHNAKFKSVKLTPQTGGTVLLSGLLQGECEVSKSTAMLDEFLNHSVDLTLTLGELGADDEDQPTDEQPRLDLGEGADDADAEAPRDEKPRKGRRRKGDDQHVN